MSIANAKARKEIAREMKVICDQGWYVAPGSQQRVDIAADLALAVQRSEHVHFSRDVAGEAEARAPAVRAARQQRALEHLAACAAADDSAAAAVGVVGQGIAATKISIVNETSLGAARALATSPWTHGVAPHVCVMNFASGTNPGGGFLWGTNAQEEHLARGSMLFPCLNQFRDVPNHYYTLNSQDNNWGINTSCAIFSPDVPVVRAPQGLGSPEPLLDATFPCSFVTIPAPKASEFLQRCDDQEIGRALIRQALTDRIERTLALALLHGCDRLVLGAFGCGVYRNDPAFVAACFQRLLSTKYEGCFDQIVFAILARNEDTDKNFAAFSAAFAVPKAPLHNPYLDSSASGSHQQENT